MTLFKINPGVDTSFSTKLNAIHAESLSISGLGMIRQMIDRTITFSSGFFDWNGEAYTASAGRNNTVLADITQALYSSTYYTPGINNGFSTDTLANADSFSNPSFAYDTSDSTAATLTTVNTSASKSLGATFSARILALARVNASIVVNSGTANVNTLSIALQTYDGSVWTTLQTLSSAPNSGTSYSGVVAINKSVQGVRVLFTYTSTGANNTTNSLFDLQYGPTKASTITHNISPLFFGPTISSSFFVPLLQAWQTGADVQYKFTARRSDEISLYSFDSVYTDSSARGSANTLTASGSGNSFVTGKVGANALSCNGSGYATKTSAANIGSYLYAWTMGGWFNIQSAPSSATVRLAALGAIGSGTELQLNYVDASGVKTISAGVNGATLLSVPYTLTTSTWFHVVFEYIPYLTGAYYRIYVNGAIQGESFVASMLGSLASTITVGAASDGTLKATAYFDDFRIWDRMLEESEITTWYNGGTGTTSSIGATAAQDSGYLNCGNTPVISTFTAFTCRPQNLIVKITPASSNPIAGYPAIYGYAARAA